MIGDDKEMPQEIPKPLAEGSTPGLKKKRERAPKGSVSKWAMMDVDNVEAGDDSDGSDIFSGDERDSNAKQNTQTRAGEPPRHEAPPAVADADDEERRQRLRQVEVEVMMLRENLEEEGLGKEEIEKRVASKRAELIAAFDNKAAQETGNPSGEDHEGCDNHVKEKGRDAEMSKAQDKERGRDREADRSRPGRDNDRDKDKERERERDRNRDRDRRRSPNPRRRSRSRTRSPKRSRGSPARRDSGRHR